MKVWLSAPAKINLTLEVLHRRPDGYHEVRTILQTIALSDWVTLTPGDDLSLALTGEVGPLASEPPEANLAYQAAARLRREFGDQPQGAHITLRKHIPIAAGLGGGSSDAAAALRGLRALWRLPLSDHDLASLAAELGADVPFFVRGGAAIASGRGDVLAALPDGPPQRLVIAWPQSTGPADKTARMYAALGPEHHTDGSQTERLAARLRAGEPIRDEDLYNVFEAVLPQVAPEAAQAFERAAALGIGRPHLCGSGPSLYFLLAPEQQAEPLLRGLKRLGLRAVETRTLPAAEAVACQEQP